GTYTHPHHDPFPTRRSSDLEEGRECGRQEQVAPAPVAEPVEVRTEEEEREPGRQKQPDGPPEIEEDEQSPAALRRQVLGQHRRRRKSTRLNSSHLGISYAVF